MKEKWIRLWGGVGKERHLKVCKHIRINAKDQSDYSYTREDYEEAYTLRIKCRQCKRNYKFMVIVVST